MKYSKYFSLKINWEKSIFHFEKYNFQLIGNSVHTREYLALEKDLLARLYLTVKVYVAKLLGVYIIYNKLTSYMKQCCLDFYIFEDSSDFENLPLLNIESTLILQFCFLDDLLKIYFLTRCLSIFTTIDEKKEEKKSTLQLFLKDVTEEKKLEIHEPS